MDERQALDAAIRRDEDRHFPKAAQNLIDLINVAMHLMKNRTKKHDLTL